MSSVIKAALKSLKQMYPDDDFIIIQANAEKGEARPFSNLALIDECALLYMIGQGAAMHFPEVAEYHGEIEIKESE